MAVVEFGNVKTDSGLTKLNQYLADHSYVVGCTPTQQDVTIFSKMLGAPASSRFHHAARWYRHIASYSPVERDNFPGQKPSCTKKDEDDDFDLFGEETQEEAAAKATTKIPPKKEEKKKKVVINKSQLVIDVKPIGIDTNLDEIEKCIRSINIDGLEWSVTCKRLPVAFGLMKLQIGCVIVDDLVNTDDILEKIECIGMNEAQTAKKIQSREAGDDDECEDEDAFGLVQSAEIVSFNKL